MGDPGNEDFSAGTFFQDKCQNVAPPPIAIVGIGLRLPGGIHSPEALWDLLINKKTTRNVVPPDRYNIESFYSPTKKAGFVAMQHGHFLAESDCLEHLDTSLFSMSKGEVEQLDPQQRMLLEVVWEAMQNGGQKNWRGKNVGVYVGTMGDDWFDLAAKDTQHNRPFGVTGSGDFAISNRVSYEYNLKGPSMTIKTACSSSLIGLNEACQALYRGDCSSAIVAGTNLVIGPTLSINQTQVGVLSPTGECRTFDASANGYSRGEAINAIFIKKLDDALRDHDPIRGVIRAATSNCDGKTSGITMPNPESHETMIRRAYRHAQLNDISDTGFVECHGTGTPTGDPLEVGAIAKVFGGAKGVYIGSIKPNIGHSEGASGVSSVVKAVLALENRIIPPNVNFTSPNPKIPFEEANLRVPLDPTAWPEGQTERVSVNSFGVTGANAHVIIDSAASFGVQRVRKSKPLTNGSANPRPHLLVFSASNTDSLQRNIAKIQEYVQENTSCLPDLAFTLGTRRDHLVHRSICVTDGSSPFEITAGRKSKKTPQLTFVFTGQGAQWAGMGKELMEDFHSFKSDIQRLNSALSGLPDPPSWNLEDELLKLEPESRLEEAEYAQPLCTAIQVALVNLLRSLGLSPSAIVGHSSGEIAGAYAADGITAEEAIIIAYYRGRVTKSCTRQGRMAAIGMGREEVGLYLQKGVVIACENGPTSVTLSGDPDQIDAVIEELKSDEPEIFARHLKTGGMAYHSHHMQEIGENYQNLIKPHVIGRRPTLPFFSSVTGENAMDSEDLGASYWRRNLESPVLFYSAVKSILKNQSSDVLFLEIGPHSALAGPLRQIFKATSGKNELTYGTTLTRGKNCTESVLKMAGQLYTQTIPINFETLTPTGRVLTDLPLYQWRHDTSFWNESRVTREWRFRKFPRHEILGSRILEGNELEPTWRNVLRLDDVPWLRDHKLNEDIVYPCAGYVGMVGEAVRQLSGTNDYTLKRLVIKKALVLQEFEDIEMVTTFRPVRLTTTLDSSSWYNFTISSYNGVTWEKHCEGQARAGQEMECPTRQITSLPRKVPNPYAALKKVGLNYGHAFQGLTEVSATPGKTTAVAKLRIPDSTDCYSLHPTTIDQCLQLFAIASSNGLTRHLSKLYVPTEVEHLYVHDGSNSEMNDEGNNVERGFEMKVEATVSAGSANTIVGNGVLIAREKVLLDLKRGKFSALEDDTGSVDSDTVAAARLEWRPHIDFVNLESLIRPNLPDPKDLERIEKFALLSMLEMQQQLSRLEIKGDHLIKFSRWLELQVSLATKGECQIFEEFQTLVTLDSQERIALIDEIKGQVVGTEAASPVELISELRKNFREILVGETEALDVLMQGSSLTNFYGLVDSKIDYKDFFVSSGHSNPNLRILEIGAGTGVTTQVALDGLTSSYGEKMYSKYTYTDISSGFFPAAKERFTAYQGMDFKILDISRDPIEQGFETGSYDVIVAANVLHATAELGVTLKNIRKLLQPCGRLFFVELSPSSAKFINLIMGVVPGWWLGEADGRPDQPYVTVERWNAELQGAGFSGIEAVVYNDPRKEYQFGVNIVARPIQPTKDFRGVTLLCGSKVLSCHERHIQGLLESHGYQVDQCTLGDSFPVHQDIISLLELENPMFDKIPPEEFEMFKQFLENLGSVGVLWVTKPIQIDCEDPRHGVSLGLARNIRTELSIPLATLELDSLNAHAYNAVIQVFDKFLERDTSGLIDPDWEYCLCDEVVNVGRYHWFSVAKELSLVSSEKRPMKLQVGVPGLLRSLGWVKYELDTLGPDEVVIEPRYVGLNFRDVLLSMGLIQSSENGLGLEGSGIVREIGTDVKGLEVGDRVMMMDKNSFSTCMVSPAKRCIRIPDSLSLEGAATMPSVYSTVIHCLMKMAQLQRDQTILIHSACGGVGIAAIQICQMIGAMIFVTVGNEEKVQYLMNKFNIPRCCIFNSRNSSFFTDLMRETHNRGVDVVLNSLSGELLHTSWQCVAEHGKMVEIGKRDFIGRGQLDMDLFEANRTFIGVDVARFTPEISQPLLEKVVSLYEQGFIKPIEPVKIFDGTKVEDSFRYMQKGQHIGKIVIKIPEDAGELTVIPKPKQVMFDPNAAYLLVGGLGGLGYAVSNWMVECGARHIIYLSRSAGVLDEHKKFFLELESQGCSVQAVAGSVIKLEDVENAVANAAKPIRGVIQMSMVLKDGPLLKMPYEDWKTATEPKVEGTWNLHRALKDTKLDFFVLFSSGSGIFGWTHQANYASGNTFLDAFVQYRHRQGLPASVLDIGCMAEIGYVSQTPVVEDALRAIGNHFLQEKDLIDALQLSILRSSILPSTRNHVLSEPFVSYEQLALGLRSIKPLSDPANRIPWRRDARTSVYHANESSASSNSSKANDALDVFLASISTDRSLLKSEAGLELITREIGTCIYGFMLRSIEEMDVAQPLTELGIDSLITVEIRNWWRRKLGVEINTLEILNGGTIKSLGELAVKRLQEKFELKV